MKVVRLGWLGVLLIAAALAGCGQKQTPVAETQVQAVVKSIEINQADGAPGTMSAVVRGELPNSCMTVGKPAVVTREGFIVVILPASRASSASGCADGPLPFQQNIPLGQSLAPGSYTLTVNGVQSVFTVAGSNTATVDIPPASTATATPSPTATQTAAMPTVTASPSITAAPTEAPVSPVPPTDTPALPTQTAEPPSLTVTGGQAQSTVTCIDKAAFYADITVPDGTVFDPGEAFTKTWQVRNAGTCSWDGYSLVFQEGDLLNAASPVLLVNSVAPGALAMISVQMTAPQKPGSYYNSWFLASSNGTLFGMGAAGNGALWAKIGVRSQNAAASPPACAFTTDATYESQILSFINTARTENGLNPLTLNTEVSNAARNHSQDMACQNFVEHYGSDGSTWFTRIKREGVAYHSASENIYAGNPEFGGTPEGAFNWWMNSQIHRDNILDPKSTQIGIGYVFSGSSSYKGYYTLDFIQP